jgi:hypothetical protein
MATILFTWELGQAMGHVAKLRPLAEALGRNGHRLFAALKDVTQAKSLSPHGAVPCVQAPVRLNPARDRIEFPATFAHILHNNGFGCREELQPLVDSWRALFDLIRPDLICCEHSPTALLASLAHPVKRIVVGTGFSCPPDLHPLPDWRPFKRNDPARLLRDEQRVLDVMNEFLGSWNQPPLARITDLYRRADRQVLATFAELDHFGSRSEGEYRGIWSNDSGQPPQWPAGEGKKVFAYLKPFPALAALLDFLRRARLPTIIFGPTIEHEFQERNSSDTLRFVSEPVDLAAAGRQAGLAILNSTHGATAAMLLAGAPLLLLPLNLEQQLLAKRVEQMGAGLAANSHNGAEAVGKLQTLLASPSYAQAAGTFAQKYANHNAQLQVDRVAQQIEELLRS